MTGDFPHSWFQWLPLAQLWYNTSFHSTINTSPFEALFGIPPPLHLPYFPNDSDVPTVDIFLRDREHALQVIKHHLQRACQRMKQQADKHRVDRSYSIGDWVFLKLQPYRQVSVRGHHQKFQAKFFGPFKIVDIVGAIAYKLQLPDSAQTHNVFHVSQLKPGFPPKGPVLDLPPSTQFQDVVPQAILDGHLVKRKNAPAT